MISCRCNSRDAIECTNMHGRMSRGVGSECPCACHRPTVRPQPLTKTPPAPGEQVAPVPLGHALRAIRSGVGMTRLELAAAMEVDEATVRAWENGSVALDSRILRRCCEILGRAQ